MTLLIQLSDLFYGLKHLEMMQKKEAVLLRKPQVKLICG